MKRRFPPFRPLATSCVVGVLVLLAGAPPVRAQATGEVAGRVLSAAGEPLPGATVMLFAGADTAAVASATTSATGRFRATGVPLGVYRLTASYLGYAPATRADVELTAPSPAADVGDIGLDLAPVELDAIEARTERSPVEILTDRTVYTTKDMPASKGGTATDLLRDVPELDVDINGNVTMRGNQAVSIQLNGRPAPLRGEALTNFLQQMPADRISKIEVMPNPTAKQDPEGTGGIVNIILMDNVDLGLSGNLTGRYGTRGSRGLNGRIAWQKGRLTVFGGLGLNGSDNQDDMSDIRQNLLATPITVLEQQGFVAYDYLFSMLDLTTEVKLAERTTGWLTTMAYSNGSTNRSNILYGLYDLDHDVLDQYDRLMVTDGSGGTTDIAVGLKHVFVPQKHELTVDARITRYGNERSAHVEQLSRLDEGVLTEVRVTDNDSDNRGFTLRADYTHPLGEKGKVDAGINLGRRDLDESALLEILPAVGAPPDEHAASTFTHAEDYNSAYLTIAQTIGELGVQLGLRGEIANTRFTLQNADETFDNDYRSLFPSVNLSYTLGEGQTARFSYSKRISRPYPGILNPYVPATDPLNRQIGNPHLLPSYSHSLSLDYSRIGKLGTLRVAPYYRRTADGWESIKRVDENGVSTVTYENSLSTESLGANVTASVRPVGRFNGSMTVGAYRYTTDASNISPEFSRANLQWTVSGNASARITPTLNAQMSARYSPPREVPQGSISAMFYTSLSLRQQLMNNRATLSMFVTDPLNVYSYRFETRDRTHIQNSRTTVSMRTASISFTFNFGKPPEQVSRREGGETTDESVRIR